MVHTMCELGEHEESSTDAEDKEHVSGVYGAPLFGLCAGVFP